MRTRQAIYSVGMALSLILTQQCFAQRKTTKPADNDLIQNGSETQNPNANRGTTAATSGDEAGDATPARTKRAVSQSQQPRPKLTVFNIEHADAGEILTVIQQLYGSGDQLYGGKATIVVDQRSNRLLYRGTDDDNLKELEALLQVLDVPTKKAQSAPGGIGSSNAKRSGSAYENIAKMPEMGAAPSYSGGRGQSQSYTYQYYSKKNPAGSLKDSYLKAEVKAAQLAQACRRLNTSEEASAQQIKQAKDALAKAVSNAFAARQKLQSAELEALTKRLQSLKKAVETRAKLKDRIIQRRIESLISEEVLWWDEHSPLNSQANNQMRFPTPWRNRSKSEFYAESQPETVAKKPVGPEPLNTEENQPASAGTGFPGLTAARSRQLSSAKRGSVLKSPEDFYTDLTEARKTVRLLDSRIKSAENLKGPGTVNADGLKKTRQQLADANRRLKLRKEQYKAQLQLLKLDVQEAESALKTAVSGFDRPKQLFGKAEVSQEELDKAQSKVTTAKAQRERAAILLNLYQDVEKEPATSDSSADESKPEN